MPMAVGHGKEVTIFESTEMRHCNPRILILFVWIRWRLASLRGKSKLRHAVSVHLPGVSGVV